jgi:hypothetical protein
MRSTQGRLYVGPEVTGSKLKRTLFVSGESDSQHSYKDKDNCMPFVLLDPRAFSLSSRIL